MELSIDPEFLESVSFHEGWRLVAHGILRRYDTDGKPRFPATYDATCFVYDKANEGSELHREVALITPWTADDNWLINKVYGIQLSDPSKALGIRIVRYPHNASAIYEAAGGKNARPYVPAFFEQYAMDRIKKDADEGKVLAIRTLRMLAVRKLSGGYN